LEKKPDSYQPGELGPLTIVPIARVDRDGFRTS